MPATGWSDVEISRQGFYSSYYNHAYKTREHIPIISKKRRCLNNNKK